MDASCCIKWFLYERREKYFRYKLMPDASNAARIEIESILVFGHCVTCASSACVIVNRPLKVIHKHTCMHVHAHVHILAVQTAIHPTYNTVDVLVNAPIKNNYECSVAHN